MNSNLQLGPLVLKVQSLVIILSIPLGYMGIRYRVKRVTGIEDIVKGRIVETFEKSFVIALLTWKFSLLLLDPIRVVTNPLSILYYSGGEFGIGLATIVLLVYLYYHAKKEQISISVYGDFIAAGFLVGLGAYSLFSLLGNLHKAGVYGSQILLVMLLYLLFLKKSKETIKLSDLNQVSLWFSLGQVFIMFLNPLKQYLWWGFSKAQIFFLILAGINIIIDFIRVKNRAD